MNKKTMIGLLLLIILVALAYCSFGKGGNDSKFRTQKASMGDISEKVTATGTLNAVTTILIGTQVSGTIKDIYVDFNTPVRKGQLLAQIDPATFQAQVAQSQADLISAKADLAKARASSLEAKRAMERNKTLYEKNFISKSELETRETAFETSEAQVDWAKARIAQSEAALRYAETNLRYTRITSPVDGIVISKSIDVGQTVAASFQTPTLFTIAKDLTKMQVDTNIDEADVGRIYVGQKAEFIVDAYPDTTFTAIVSEVRNSPMVVQNVVTYDVVITVDNPERKLKPGMTANVSVIIEKKKGVLRIPNAALRFTPRDSSPPSQDGVCVWILEKGNPVCRKVTTGISDGDYTEVRSGAISQGQELLTEEISDKKKSGAGMGQSL